MYRVATVQYTPSTAAVAHPPHTTVPSTRLRGLSPHTSRVCHTVFDLYPYRPPTRHMQRRLDSMRVNEDARNVLSRAAMMLKHLGRAEWSEIKGMKAPSASLLRMMGGVRLLLGNEIDATSMLPSDELPTEWVACVRMLSHSRFISRLLKLTRGTLTVPDVAWVIIERKLPELGRQGSDDDAQEGEIDESASERSSVAAGGGEARVAHTELVLRKWLGALLRSRKVRTHPVALELHLALVPPLCGCN